MEKYTNNLNFEDVLKLFLDDVIDNCLDEYYQELISTNNLMKEDLN
ncbi:hypothetical protein GSQ51_15910 [Clostridioides difficile]|nr:hypothetical protein [Clostridioides difficile]NJK15578.1 hypothetical protein [Clostridioides difficile]